MRRSAQACLQRPGRVEGLFDEGIYELVDQGDGTQALVRAKKFSFCLLVSGPGPWLVHYEPVGKDLVDSDPVIVRAPANKICLVCPPAATIEG